MGAILKGFQVKSGLFWSLWPCYFSHHSRVVFCFAVVSCPGSVEVSLEDAVELFIAADLYTLDRLKVYVRNTPLW